MLIPVEWLREYVDAPQAFEQPEALADRLTTTGNEIEEIRESESGPVFYLKLTPNRADMLAMQGAAREIAALYETQTRTPSVNAAFTGPPETGVRVDLEAPDLCPRYAARIIRGVKVGPSPEWLRKRLEAAGSRSISNVVDVTNYVMLEMGQPLHAFDLDLLAENRIVVRRARPEEKLVAIDGTDVALQPEMLVIADAERAVAIAGVMGGRDTEVHDGTVNLLLESAFFNATSVRRTSKRCGISSAASYRFERGVDPNGVIAAADRAAALIAELAGGTVSETLIDVYPTPIAAPVIPFRVQRCRDLLGIEVTDDDAEAYLTRLGLFVERDNEPWQVTAPTWRPDLAIEEDVIEEVGRMYGYDRLPETLPTGASGAGSRSGQDLMIREIRNLLTGLGLYEAVTSTLVARSYLEKSGLTASPAWPGTDAQPVVLRNPLSEEFDTLRPSLLPGLLLATEHNLRHGTKDVFLFETGYVHRRPGADGEPEDRLVTGGLLMGSRTAGQWNSTAAPADTRPADFFTAKGVVEALIHGLGLRGLSAEPLAEGDAPASFHPGRTAWLLLNGTRLGLVGELHPRTAQALDLPRGVYAFELDATTLLAHQGEVVRYEAPSRFPRALRDLAVVVDADIPSARIEAILREAAGPFGRGVRLFDVYTGKPIPEGRVSLTYSLELGVDDRTLTDAEVEERLSAARERLRTELNAEFRG